MKGTACKLFIDFSRDSVFPRGLFVLRFFNGVLDFRWGEFSDVSSLAGFSDFRPDIFVIVYVVSSVGSCN